MEEKEKELWLLKVGNHLEIIEGNFYAAWKKLQEYKKCNDSVILYRLKEEAR